MVRNGVAYIQHLVCILESNNEPLPEGIVVSHEMFESIEHMYPAVCRFSEIFGMKMQMATVFGIKVYRGEK